MQFPTHSAVRDVRTALFIERPGLFLKRLRAELTLLETDALQHDLQPAVRLNGTSDLAWERIAPDLFADFPAIQFFDYTKLYRRMRAFLDRELPGNYHLTFSAEARCKHAADVLFRGGNVAAVFWPELPASWWQIRVIDGDVHDARFLDPCGVVVGLRAKGLARVDTKGFTIRPCPTCGPTAREMELISAADDTHRTTVHRCGTCQWTLRTRWRLRHFRGRGCKAA